LTQEKKNLKNNSEYLISIIIVNYNGRKYLGEILDDCIKSIIENDYENYEILFVDNGSKDDSIEHIKKNFSHEKRLKIIPLGDNYGTTGAKNRGIRLSKGELIYLLNTDIYLKKNTLKKMNKVMQDNKDIGILSCKLVGPDGKLQTQGESFYSNSSLLGVLYRSLYERVYLKNIKRRDNLNLVDWISGGALMIRSSLFEQIGEYDENYFMYSEEVELAYRVKKLGYKVACLSDYETIHYHKLTTRHYSRWQSDLVYRNMYLYMIKNFRGERLAFGLGCYILGIMHSFALSLIRLDEIELKNAYSKIRAFSYSKKPPKRPDNK